MSTDPRTKQLSTVYLTFPRHPAEKKVRRDKKKRVGLLVSIQERRTLLVPLVQRRLCLSIGLHWISLVRAATETSRTSFLVCRTEVRIAQSSFPDMPCMKRVYKDKNAKVHWSTTGNEERLGSAGKRGSNADFVPSVYMGFRLFALRKRRPRHPYTMSSRVEGIVVSWAKRFVGTCPARPRPASLPRRAPPRTAPPVVCPGLRFDRFPNFTNESVIKM